MVAHIAMVFIWKGQDGIWRLVKSSNPLPKEMFVPMPVINCKGILSSAQDTTGVFLCPVYKTQFRGPTFCVLSTI